MKKIISLFLLCAMLFSFSSSASFAQSSTPQIISSSAVLIDAQTGQVLYNKSMDRQMYPASITKILTGIIALETLSLDTALTVNASAIHFTENVSHVALLENEVITLEQAMYALAIESANDAANVIAENISGSIADFGVLMTDYAHSLGATNSNFINPSGLPDDNHYTTAYDMALIAMHCVQNDVFNSFFTASRYEMAPTNLRAESRYFNASNHFNNGVNILDGLVMTKDGWTSDAQNTLVTAATRDGMTLIAVVMHSQSSAIKYTDTHNLFDWGFNQFASVDIPADYITLSAPERINCDSDGKFFIEKTSLVAQDISLTAQVGTTIDDIIIEYSDLLVDYTTESASLTANFFTQSGDEKTLVAQTLLTGIVSESRVAGIIIEQDPRTPFENITIMFMFSILSFMGIIIFETLINKRYH